MDFVTPLTAALLLVIVLGVSVAILAWRERPEAGATWLTLLVAGQVWWTVFLVFEIEATAYGMKVLWYDVQWIGVVVIPVAWLLFALEYTGHTRYVQPWTVVAVSVVPALTVLIAFVNGTGLLVEGFVLVETPFGSFLRAEQGPWYFLIAGYTYLLGLLGTVPILQFVRDDGDPFRGQSAALLVGTAAPWVSSIVYVLGYFPITGLDPTPFAFSVSGVAYLLAVTRFRLLTISPAPRRQARQIVFEYLHDPAFVLDTEGYVVDFNESAASTFGLDRSTTVGAPARSAVPEYETLVAAAEGTDGATSERVTAVGTAGRRPYDVTVRDVRNTRHRAIGRVIVYHDIGEYLNLQQRLEVLNRVFRHNVRTETNLVLGYLDRVIENPDDEEAIDVVKRSTRRIHELSERTRSASDMFDPTSDSLDIVPLESIVSEPVEAIREEFPNATVSVDGELPDVRVPRVVRVVVENLLSNAIRHNEAPNPSAWVSASTDGAWVDVVVADDGCGIEEAEYAVLKRGTETPLEHGSGIGLWIVKWGADLAGGRVSFAERDPAGTEVTVRVPRRDPDGA